MYLRVGTKFSTGCSRWSSTAIDKFMLRVQPVDLDRSTRTQSTKFSTAVLSAYGFNTPLYKFSLYWLNIPYLGTTQVPRYRTDSMMHATVRGLVLSLEAVQVPRARSRSTTCTTRST